MTDDLKLGRDAFTCMNAIGVIIMSLETQLRCLLSGKNVLRGQKDF